METLAHESNMTRDELIKEIQEFVGEGGYVAFEHGFRPNINSYGVGYDYMHLRMPMGEKRYFKDMDEAQLQNLLFVLFRYLNYCQKYA